MPEGAKVCMCRWIESRPAALRPPLPLSSRWLGEMTRSSSASASAATSSGGAARLPPSMWMTNHSALPGFASSSSDGEGGGIRVTWPTSLGAPRNAGLAPGVAAAASGAASAGAASAGAASDGGAASAGAPRTGATAAAVSANIEGCIGSPRTPRSRDATICSRCSCFSSCRPAWTTSLSTVLAVHTLGEPSVYCTSTKPEPMSSSCTPAVASSALTLSFDVRNLRFEWFSGSARRF